MSLTAALALLGAVVLAVLGLQFYLAARRVRVRHTAEPLPATAQEPAGDGASARGSARAPIEPSFDNPPASAPVLDASLPLQPEARPARRARPCLDPLIDAIAALSIEAHVTGELALVHLPPTRRAGSKPFFVEGRNLRNGEWEPPSIGQRYSEFQVGVQLANRHGAINEIEYSEFVQKVQSFADGIGAMPDFPDMLDVVARARELDQFASTHDAQLAVHLRARSVAWGVNYIQQHAARHGFMTGLIPGRLQMAGAGESAPPMLVLAFDSQAAFSEDPNQAALRDVTLSFDVPQTDAAHQPFAAWQASAQALALGMDAIVVDDNGQPLSTEGFAAIGAELTQLYAELAEHDLTAGSAVARRLFS